MIKHTYKALICGLALACNLSYAQEALDNDSVINILLGAYNGAAKAYEQETGEQLPSVARQDLDTLNTQLKQIETLISDDDGDIDLEKLNRLLQQAKARDYEFLGIKLTAFEQPLQLLEQAQQQAQTWQETLQDIQKQSNPLISDALAELGHNDSQEANALSILIGAGMALEQLSQTSPARRAQSAELSAEINHLQQIAQAQHAREYLPPNTAQVIAALKIAYAESNLQEHPLSSQQQNIHAIETLINSQQTLSEAEYTEIAQWLQRLGTPYQTAYRQWQENQAQLLAD